MTNLTPEMERVVAALRARLSQRAEIGARRVLKTTRWRGAKMPFRRSGGGSHQRTRLCGNFPC